MGQHEFCKVLSTKRIGTKNKFEIEEAAFAWVKEECDKIQRNFQHELDELKYQLESQIEELSKPNKALEQALKTILSDNENEVTQTVRDIVYNETKSLRDHVDLDDSPMIFNPILF